MGIEITQNPDGLTIILPSPGFRGSKAEIKFGLAFAGVVCLITVVFVLVLSGQQAPRGVLAVAVSLLSLFWCVAAGLIANAWRRARRRAVIDVIGKTLLITTEMPFSRGSIEIERANIRALGVGPSGVMVDNNPVPALRLDLRKPVPVGKKNRRVIKLFRERSEEDLGLIAGALREALDIATDADPAWAQDAAVSDLGSSHHHH